MGENRYVFVGSLVATLRYMMTLRLKQHIEETLLAIVFLT